MQQRYDYRWESESKKKQEEESRKAGRIGRREDNEQEANESEVKEDVFVYEQEKGLV